jgi:hypothetical protein
LTLTIPGVPLLSLTGQVVLAAKKNKKRRREKKRRGEEESRTSRIVSLHIYLEGLAKGLKGREEPEKER